jgi:hypothetical protein
LKGRKGREGREEEEGNWEQILEGLKGLRRGEEMRVRIGKRGDGRRIREESRIEERRRKKRGE